jgi:hypothetical protein
MKERRQGDSAGGERCKQEVSMITPSEKERPRDATLEMEKAKSRGKASSELVTILKQFEAAFGKQASSNDLEMLNFSLRHLFNRVDFLYCEALPSLESWERNSNGDSNQEMLQQQRIWLQLQTVNRTLDRMAPLCHLLSDVIECLLDTLDDEGLWLHTLDDEDTLQMRPIKVQQDNEPKQHLSTPHPEAIPEISPECWGKAVNTIMYQLLIWQDQHHKLTPFQQKFSQPIPLIDNLSELDIAFTTLLESAAAIFGDILPNFRLVRPEDRQEIAALLFDLMQQSDQMLIQFELTLEPFTKLIRHFAVLSNS